MEAHLWLGLLPALSIACLNWSYSIFILNRFRGVCMCSKAQIIAFVLYIFGGYAAWIAEMSILHESLGLLQVFASIYRTCANWLGFLFIVNERLVITRQQMLSLLFVCAISSLWEIQHRLVLRGNV